MSVESPPAFTQANTFGAEQTRRAVFLPFSTAGGVKASGDLAVTAPVSGMTVNVATGEVLVPGSSSSTQGLYYGRVSSTSNLAVAASNPSNPRIDMVYAAITDAAYTGATNTFVVAVATGTPTSGATLVNLNGAPALPTSAIILAYCLVPANATNIITADLSDQRVRIALSNTASTASTSVQTFAGSLSAPGLVASGSTGAATSMRIIGANASGAPASGAWLVDDVAGDSTGKLWFCTVAGTPGTWVQIGSASYAPESGFSGYNSTTQSIPASTTTTLLFDTESFDQGNYHSTVSNTSRMTVPATGYYVAGGGAQLNGIGASKRVYAEIAVNGVVQKFRSTTGSGDGFPGPQISGLLSLTANDYVEIVLTQTDTGAVSTIANCSNGWIQRVA